MTFIDYNLGIPDAPNNPSADQPLMKINNDNNALMWSQDHFAFKASTNNSGKHKQVTLTNQSPPGFAGGTMVMFADLDNGASVPWVQNALFTLPLITGNVPVIAGNGYTSIFGGVILQWGLKTGLTSGSGASNIVTFPITFPTNTFAVFVQPLRVASSNVDTLYVLTGSVTTSGFTIVNTSSSIPTAYFFAIGN